MSILHAGHAEARPVEARFAVGGALRNGDWLTIEPSGLVLLGSWDGGANLAATARGVAGLGGSGVALGLATGLGGPCLGPGPCTLRESLFSSVIGVEARVERMYGPTTWRRAAYAGPQLTFGGIFLKGSVGWMFDLDGGTDSHFQLGLGEGW